MEIIILASVLIFFYIMVKGAVKTFQRQAVVAILCIIFLLPVWLIWAFFEGLF
jgi:hypothetical protein